MGEGGEGVCPDGLWRVVPAVSVGSPRDNGWLGSDGIYWEPEVVMPCKSQGPVNTGSEPEPEEDRNKVTATS